MENDVENGPDAFGAEQISAFERFLEYGPIGLAGLMLVLVVVALALRELTPIKAGLLKFFMAIGAACFAILLAADVFVAPREFQMNVSVVPSNLEAVGHAAAPALQVDGVELDPDASHAVDDDFAMLIDLNATVEAAEAEMDRVRGELQADLADLQASAAREHSAMQARLDAVSTKLEAFQAIQDLLSRMSSSADGVEDLRLSRELDRELSAFIADLSSVVN